jgi:hypothetical protein
MIAGLPSIELRKLFNEYWHGRFTRDELAVLLMKSFGLRKHEAAKRFDQLVSDGSSPSMATFEMKSCGIHY